MRAMWFGAALLVIGCGSPIGDGLESDGDGDGERGSSAGGTSNGDHDGGTSWSGGDAPAASGGQSSGGSQVGSGGSSGGAVFGSGGEETGGDSSTGGTSSGGSGSGGSASGGSSGGSIASGGSGTGGSPASGGTSSAEELLLEVTIDGEDSNYYFNGNPSGTTFSVTANLEDCCGGAGQTEQVVMIDPAWPCNTFSFPCQDCVGVESGEFSDVPVWAYDEDASFEVSWRLHSHGSSMFTANGSGSAALGAYSLTRWEVEALTNECDEQPGSPLDVTWTRSAVVRFFGVTE